MNPDQLIAHRGWQRRFPENTLLAVEGAINAGARFIEIDVQISADRVPHLFHDATLHRVCRQPGALHEYAAEELARFAAGEPDRFGDRYADTPLTTLAETVELIERHTGVHLFAEVKEEAITHFGSVVVHDAVVPVLSSIADRTTLISFDVDYLRHARKSEWARVGPVLRSWHQMHKEAVAALDPAVVFVDRRLLPADADPASIPWPLAVYELVDPDEARALIDRGVRWVETFAFGEMLANGEAA